MGQSQVFHLYLRCQKSHVNLYHLREERNILWHSIGNYLSLTKYFKKTRVIICPLCFKVHSWMVLKDFCCVLLKVQSYFASPIQLQILNSRKYIHLLWILTLLAQYLSFIYVCTWWEFQQLLFKLHLVYTYVSI